MGSRGKNKIERRILVADDDQSIRQLVCTVVRREGFTADAAADGIEAVELIRQHDYPVILLDLMMPRMDGFGVIAHLREHPSEVKPIVLVITAYADQRFKEVDPYVVAGVLRKPFDVSELGSLIHLCLKGRSELASRLQEGFGERTEVERMQDRYNSFDGSEQPQ